MSRNRALLLVATAAAVPRLVVVAVEREQLVAGLTEKSNRFARTFVESGTFGFIPGRPSANTQPLYGFFLTPFYWIFGQAWWPAIVAQVVVAIATAMLVYAIGATVATRGIGTGAALLATLNPYLIWHDVHPNREIVDGLLAALLTLLVVLAVRRASIRIAALAGLAAGLAILGNARLILLPLALAGYLSWTIAPGRRGLWAAAALVVVAAVTVTPWVVRNNVSVGCPTITTDARALWKANNPATFEILRHGGWIDQVPELPGAPPWPELAADQTLRGNPITVDECAQMRFYQHQVLHFWRTQPGEKGKLAAQAVWMLWRPVGTIEGGNSLGPAASFARSIVEPVYLIALYTLTLLGLGRLPRRYLALTLILLAYGTVMAMAFAGTLRYNAPWHFLLCIPAAFGIVRLAEALKSRRRGQVPT